MLQGYYKDTEAENLST